MFKGEPLIDQVRYGIMRQANSSLPEACVLPLSWSKNTPGERCIWETITRSVPLTTNVPFGVIKGISPMNTSCSLMSLTERPVMKAIGISSESDLKKVKSYCEVCDQILFDAKPSSKDALPGGNGLQFDWSVLANKKWSKPWMLAGGLNAANVEKAVKVTNARQFDSSSSIELIVAFIPEPHILFNVVAGTCAPRPA